jgi:hypothetical protein
MSLTSDLRAYADSAREQGTELVAKLTTTVSGLTATANSAVVDLRGQAAKSFDAVRSDSRVSGLVDRAESVARPVVTLVQERVVQPVQERVVQPVQERVLLPMQERVVQPALSLTRRDSAVVIEPAPSATPSAPSEAAATRPAPSPNAPATEASPSA